jgi:ABC-type oligopeptide transport system substrate-binding subunit
MAVLLVTIVVGSVATLLVWQGGETQRHQALVASAWNKADVAFRQAQFDDAKAAYEQVVVRSDEWGRPGKIHTQLARRMKDLAEQAEEFSASLADTTVPLKESAFDKVFESVSELLGQQAMPVAGMAVEETDGVDPPVGLDFTVSARVGKLVDGWLVGQAETMSAGLAGDASVESVAVERLEQLATWLARWQRDTSELEKACREARARILRSGESERFTVAGNSALTAYSAQSVLKALVALDAWEKAGGGDAVTEARENLMASLGAKLKEMKPLEAEPDGGRPLVVGPPVVGLSADSAKVIGQGRPVVFVNDEDELFVLDAETGEPGWAVRRGFDNGWLPASGRIREKAVSVVSWRRAQRMYLSCLESQTGIPIWTRRMPVNDGQLWQSVIVHQSSVLVPTEAGLVIQLDLASGRTRSRIQLPEALAAPCVLNVKDQRLACLGRQLGIYTLGLVPKLTIEEVHLRDAAVDNGQAYMVWFDSLLMVAANREDSRCRLSVFRIDDGRFVHLGEEDVEIEGHLWQPPTVLGDAMFLATDSGRLVKLVVSPGSGDQPVKMAWSDDGGAVQLGLRPYLLSHAEAPLLRGFGGSVTASFPVIGAAGNEADVRLAWKWKVAHEGQVVCQPLQDCPRGVVVVVRQPGKSGVVVNCLDLTSGRQVWRWTNGVESSDPGPLPETSVDRQPWSLVVGHFDALQSLDPWNAMQPLEREVVPLLFDRLLQPGVNGLRHVKGTLVREYKVLPGTQRSSSGAACRAYQFHIDTSRVFHDGSRLDAGDVVESVRRLGDARVQWGQREQSRMLRSPRMLDPTRFEVLVRPYLATGSVLNVYVAPRQHYATLPAPGSALSSVPIGSGRFEVTDRSRPQETVLGRSRHHPASKPGKSGIRKIVFRRFSAARLDEMASQWRDGRLDMIAGLGTAELSALRAKGVEGLVRPVATRRVLVLVFNHKVTPFDNLQIRHKFARLLDMQFRREVLSGLGEIEHAAAGVDSVIPPPESGQLQSRVLPPLPKTLVSHYLKQIAEAAGGKVLSLKFDVGNLLAERGAVAISDRLASSSLGIKVERLSGDQFQDEVRQRHSFDMALCVLDYSDPLLNLGGFLDTRVSGEDVVSMNFLGFAGQQAMQTVVDFRNAQVWGEVLTARQALDDLIRDHAVLVPLWTDPQFAILSPTIRCPPLPVQHRPGPWLFHRLDEWSREP